MSTSALPPATEQMVRRIRLLPVPDGHHDFLLRQAISLSHLTGRSAALFSQRAIGLKPSYCRVVVEVGRQADGATGAELVERLDVDPAQISRIANALIDDGLLERAAPRGPYRLTATGIAASALAEEQREATEAAVAAAIDRNAAALLRRLMFSVFQNLIAEAAAHDLDERQTTANSYALAAIFFGAQSGRNGSCPPVDDRRAVLAMLLLCARIMARVGQRGRARLGDFRELDVHVLVWIAELPAGIGAPDLTRAMERDRIQIHRALKRLEAAGLIRSVGAERRARFHATAAGATLHRQLMAESSRQDQAYCRGLRKDDRALLIASLVAMNRAARERVRIEHEAPTPHLPGAPVER